MHANASAIDSAIYSDIFSTPAMRALWSDQARIQRYLDVEEALAAAQAELGVIPARAAAEIARHCDVEQMDFAMLKTATEHVGYPVLPVVQQLTALCRDDLGQWCHWGATTQDITDTATVLQIRAALDLVSTELDAIAVALATLARDHRETPMIGRSNLQQAVPMTFGYKVATWLVGIDRHRERLSQLRPRVLVGEFGGAVGTLASLGDRGLSVQEELLHRLNLPQPTCSWHTIRDGFAEVGCFLGLVCASLEKIAFDVKVMMSTELAEVQEPGGASGRGASSTMPQKRNPISCAYITACNSVVRQEVAALLTAVVADFERSTGAWETEWLVLPQIFCYSAGALAQARFMLSGLVVHPDHMRRNLAVTDGLVCTEAVMMALAPKIGRGVAHDKLSAVCGRVTDGEGRLLDLLDAEPEIHDQLDRATLEGLLDPTNYLGLSTIMTDRVLKSHRP